MKVRRSRVQPSAYLRQVVTDGVVDYRKEKGHRARLRANLLTLTAVMLTIAAIMLLAFNFDGELYSNYFVLSGCVLAMAASYWLFKMQKQIRRGVPPNIISIDTNLQVLSAGIDDEKVMFRFDEIQDVLVNSKMRNTAKPAMCPTCSAYSIVLWTTDDVYFPLMEPLWEINVPMNVEYEHLAREIANDIRDLIRRSLIVSKSRDTAPEPSILVEEY
jgi:hypothetical protein